MRRKITEIHTIIPESTSTLLMFNVMPDKPVSEKLSLKEYRIGTNYIEALFDREYTSSMIASPSHLVFLSMLIQWQKLVYVYMCHHLGYLYSPMEPECLKVWPTKLRITLPTMVVEEEDLVQGFWIDEIKNPKEGCWKVVGETRVGSISMSGETVVFPVSVLAK